MPPFYIQDICTVPSVAADDPELAVYLPKDCGLLLAYRKETVRKLLYIFLGIKVTVRGLHLIWVQPNLLILICSVCTGGFAFDIHNVIDSKLCHCLLPSFPCVACHESFIILCSRTARTVFIDGLSQE